MTDQKVIAVVGAIGAQGRGLVRAILENPDAGYRVRAITRTPLSMAARALACCGVDVVAGNVDDTASLTDALRGAHGAFFPTFFWKHLSADREVAQARAMATAARDADVQHVIWSTREDTHDTSSNGVTAEFASMRDADRAFADLGVPTTRLYTSFNWEHLITAGIGPKMGPTGELILTLPIGDAPLPGIASDDIGRSAFGIFQHGARCIGQTIGVAGDQLTGTAMANQLSRALSRTVRYRAIAPQHYRALGIPGAGHLGNMFQFTPEGDGSFGARRCVSATRALHPGLLSFDMWLLMNACRIPIDVVVF